MFDSLDTGANKAEEFISNYKNFIIGVIGGAALLVLSYLGYQSFVVAPKAQEAISELNQAQYYFDLAVNSTNGDSLYMRALNGGEGKYGFRTLLKTTREHQQQN